MTGPCPRANLRTEWQCPSRTQSTAWCGIKCPTQVRFLRYYHFLGLWGLSLQRRKFVWASLPKGLRSARDSPSKKVPIAAWRWVGCAHPLFTEGWGRAGRETLREPMRWWAKSGERPGLDSCGRLWSWAWICGSWSLPWHVTQMEPKSLAHSFSVLQCRAFNTFVFLLLFFFHFFIEI